MVILRPTNTCCFYVPRTKSFGLTVALPCLAAGHTQETRDGGDKRHPFGEDGATYSTAEAVGRDTKDQFNRYVRGLCVICNEGTFDQMLELLFRAYAVARDDRTISRREMAAILAKHVVYEDAEVMTSFVQREVRQVCYRMGWKKNEQRPGPPKTLDSET